MRDTSLYSTGRAGMYQGLPVLHLLTSWMVDCCAPDGLAALLHRTSWTVLGFGSDVAAEAYIKALPADLTHWKG